MILLIINVDDNRVVDDNYINDDHGMFLWV